MSCGTPRGYNPPMDYDALIFDLDGTLWDAAAASTHGWNIALGKLGASTRVTVDDIRSVSGRPFDQCVAALLPELYPLDDATVEFIDDHERSGIEEMGGSIYDGVADGLRRLSQHYRLFLVSNCPDWYLDAFFDFSGLRECFAGWDCHGRSGLHKSTMLSRLAEEHHLGPAAYVGDTQGDREAAEAAGMDFVYVSYGFGEISEPDMSFASFGDLVDGLVG